MFRSKMLSVVCCAIFACTTSSIFAQEGQEKDNTIKKADTSATLSEDGKLVGKVFATVEGKETPLEAKVTLATSEGVVLETIQSKEDGLFAFASLEPGVYQMYGSADNYYGGQSVEVMPYSGTNQTYGLGLDSSSSAVYETCGSAPAASCGGCGGGGGILGNRRFLRLAAIGGIVAIAVSGDSSPDN